MILTRIVDVFYRISFHILYFNFSFTICILSYAFLVFIAQLNAPFRNLYMILSNET